MKTSVTQCPTSTHPAKKIFLHGYGFTVCNISVLCTVSLLLLSTDFYLNVSCNKCAFSFQSDVFVNVQSIVCSFSLCLLQLYCALHVFSSLCLVVLFSCILRIAFSRLCLISKLISNSLFVAIDILADCHVHDLWTVCTLLFGVSISRNFFS